MWTREREVDGKQDLEQCKRPVYFNSVLLSTQSYVNKNHDV